MCRLCYKLKVIVCLGLFTDFAVGQSWMMSLPTTWCKWYVNVVANLQWCVVIFVVMATLWRLSTQWSGNSVSFLFKKCYWLLSLLSFGVSQETAVAFIENISCKELSISEEDFEWFVYMLDNISTWCREFHYHVILERILFLEGKLNFVVWFWREV